MTGHQVNDLATSFVEMAKAYERLPQVEAELRESVNGQTHLQEQLDATLADLNQAKDYAASLEAKVHAAEASRDDAELRFLELDEKVHNVLDRARASAALMEGIERELDPPKHEPVVDHEAEALVAKPYEWPEPIVSKVKPIAVDPIGVNATENGSQNVSASIGSALPYLDNPSQGQSEADPIQPLPAPTTMAEASHFAETIATSEDAASGLTSWATQTPSKPQPYAGKTWTEIAATANHYIGYNEWKEGGGTDENWNS